MKGFGIEIKNNLLEPKHVEAMGISVWLYMWLIDHLTSVDEKGVGKVLGGKPVKYEDIEKDLGISADTYTRWIDKLVEYPYIEAIRTPHGISYRVFKAYKNFGKSTSRVIPHKSNSDSAKMRSDSAQPRKVNKDNTKTITKDKDTGIASDPNIPLIIDLFKEVNPSYQRLFAMPPQRKAVERLLKTHGFDKLSSMIAFLPKSNATKYAPTITTPGQFELKLGELIAWSQKQKDTSTVKKAIVV